MRSWPFAWTVALALHAGAAVLPVQLGSHEAPLQVVSFELASLPPEPPPPPPPPPPPEEKPPGPKNPDPPADPEVTSLASNRDDVAPPSEPVPIVTGLPLEADQLVDGGMGVRVGNTYAPGYDADVDPSELRGFAGGGAGGGEGGVAVVTPDVEAELLRSFQPEYPDAMKQQGIEGRVLLLVTVLPNGRAGRVELLQGVHPDLDRVAMAAMRRFRWRPARRRGAKVESQVRLAIRFELRS